MHIALLSLCCLLFGRPVPVAAQQPRAEALLESAAELLRISNNKLYLWLEDSLVVNDDYRIIIAGGQADTLRVGVEESIDRIVVSESLPDSLIRLVQEFEEPKVTLSLSAAIVAADTVLIGAPAALVSFYDGLSATSSVTGAVYRLVPFANLEEAEIDLAVGKLNLLILPETEVDSRFECDYRIYRTAALVEWHLLCDLPDYDLMPAALAYCLKGLVSSPAKVPQSFIVSSQHLRRFFPPLLESAVSLFSQIPAASKSRLCVFPAALEFPGLVKRIDAQLRRCGGSLVYGAATESSKIALGVSLVKEGDPQPTAAVAANLLRLAASLEMSWSSSAGKLAPSEPEKNGGQAPTDFEALSHMLASEIRVVPLGISAVLIVARPEAHSLRYHGTAASFRDFYLVNQQ